MYSWSAVPVLFKATAFVSVNIALYVGDRFKADVNCALGKIALR